MITNIHRAKTASDVQRYVRYTLAPKEENENENYKAGERVLDIDTQYISIGPDVEHNATSHDVTNQIIEWNKEHRPGKNAPKCPALLGEFSFTKADKEQFYIESHTGERYIDTDKVLAVCKKAIGMTMSDDRPMFLSVHGDTECLHVHFAAAMVDSHGKIWDGSTLTDEHGNKTKVRDYRQWELTNEKLEIEYGLERVQHRKAMMHEGEHRQSQVKRPSNEEVHLLKDKGELTHSMRLAGRLDEVYNKSNGQFDKFLELTEQYRIRIKPNMSATKVNGLAFATEDMDGFIKASDLGKRYKWTNLEKELNYEHSRDFQKLAELRYRESTNGQVAKTSINTTSELTRITEELTRVTEELTETVRIEQGANVADNGISSSLGHEDRIQSDKPSGLHEEVTGQRAFEGSITTADTIGSATHGCITTSNIRVCDSPSPMRNNGVRNVEHEQQDKQPAVTTGTDAERNILPEQTNIRGSDEEDKVKLRELRIKTIMKSGAMTREHAEFAYDTQQKIAEKRAAEKDQASTWTPDNPVAKEPAKENTNSHTDAMRAWQNSLNAPKPSRNWSQSSDGFSI